MFDSFSGYSPGAREQSLKQPLELKKMWFSPHPKVTPSNNTVHLQVSLIDIIFFINDWL